MASRLDIAGVCAERCQMTNLCRVLGMPSAYFIYLNKEQLLRKVATANSPLVKPWAH